MLQPSDDNKQQTKRTCCKSEYIIYLLECILCKIQYVGKAETAFNLRFMEKTQRNLTTF